MVRRHLRFTRRYLRAIRHHSVELTLVVFAIITMTLLSASAMFWAERSAGTFPSFWSAVYWAIQTITTVGYGDFVPATTLGQVIAVATSLLGAGFLVLTAGMLATMFVLEMRGEGPR